jgi:hypothetical protein
MISHLKTKYLLLLGALAPMASLKAEIDTSLWAGVEDAFAKIQIADAHFKSSELVFKQLNVDYSSLILDFDIYRAKRQAAFSCIKSSIESLEGRLDLAIIYKAKVEYDAATEQALLREEIESIRNEKNAIIKGLNDAKSALQIEIDGLEVDLATLASMNATKVDQALIDIVATGDSYRAMKVEREAFMTVLDNALAKAAAFEAEQRSEMSSMSTTCAE